MLTSLQAHLCEIYQASSGHQVIDFLITDRAHATALARRPVAACVEETVLVEHDDGGMALGVYLDEELLARLKGKDPLRNIRPDIIGDLTTVLEGISHFNYLAWSAEQDRSVTLLELELQAEVDKFVAVLLLALRQQDVALARRLHSWIFDRVSYHRSLDRDQRERYETANDYAARFCHRIYRRIGEGAAIETTMSELRSFYRMSQAEKISYIHSSAWAAGSAGLYRA